VAARLLVLALIAIVLVGCGRSNVIKRERHASAPAPVQQAIPQSGEYRVVRGDTLYGIAFRHGLDYRDVARFNRISPPYTIYPGQIIRLRPGQVASARPGSGSASSAAPARTPTTATPRQTASPPPPAATGSAPPARPATNPSVATPPSTRGPVAWRWPADGQLIGRFVAGDQTRQGIDIAGNAGQPVRASADGVVVYSGAGLVGYGELVIIKHSDEWLSAYGHNRRRLVAEGEKVASGQQIAEMGRTGASRDMLHFEIRRNGKPVDPLPLLPGR
jgi:lipoprotein NlpD